MIPVTLSQFVLILMLPGLLSIAYWWLRTVGRDYRKDRILLQSTLRCRICSCLFSPKEPEGAITHCPSCNSANINRSQRII
jgi:predicted Zn-ribbon and HTH transcriptional regulator